MVLKMPDLRIVGAIACGLCAVGVDFVSTLMSVVVDMFFIGLIFAILWPKLSGEK